MNRIRILLRRDGAIRRGLLLVVFAVLLSRALLSSVVMLDPLAPAGSFGLVMCSGQGALFGNGTPGAHASPMSGMDMDMGPADMAGASDHASLAGAVDHDGLSDGAVNHGPCPFSAALSLGIVALACAALFLLLPASASPAWPTARLRRRARVDAYARPAARAPPRA